MFASILTTLSFACSGLCGGRASKSLGGIHAAFWCNTGALAILAIYACLLGQGFRGQGLLVFVVSGAVGLGIGDIALFESYIRIGARRTVLLAQCLTAPIACLTEWCWLGTTLTAWQLLFGVIILLGVGISLTSAEAAKLPRPLLYTGILYGILAAAGQALGAVLSRYAHQLNLLANTPINATTASFQRMLGGELLVLLAYCGYLYFRRQKCIFPDHSPGWRWLIGNILAGPVIGVSFFQWALATTPSGIVLSIVATTPIAIMPLTHWFDGDRLTWRNLSGAVIAIGGVIGLILQ